MAKSGRKKRYLYSAKDLDTAVRAMLGQMSKDDALNSKTANVRAAAAMLHALGAASGGAVIQGCCTQGCCNTAVLKMIEDMD